MPKTFISSYTDLTRCLSEIEAIFATNDDKSVFHPCYVDGLPVGYLIFSDGEDFTFCPADATLTILRLQAKHTLHSVVILGVTRRSTDLIILTTTDSNSFTGWKAA